MSVCVCGRAQVICALFPVLVKYYCQFVFKQLHLLKSYEIYKCQLLKFLFKLANKQQSIYVNQLPFASTAAP